MREFEGIDKALTRIQGELANNAGKLTEIDAHIAREQGKLEEIEDSPDLQVHEERVKAILADLKEERAARLELLSQNRKELASQFARIRQTTRKNPRWRSKPAGKAQARFQRTRANHHGCVDLDRI